jgi:hypothetical protein
MKGQNFLTSSGGSSPASNSRAPRKHFALKGRSVAIDPRHDAVRADLADIDLADRFFAPHYARAMPTMLAADTPLLIAPKPDAEILGALSAGTIADLFDINGAWAWVRTSAGVGYIAIAAIAPA